MAGSASRRISPELVVAAGCAIALITAGPRATAGLFQIPMTTEYGWGRDVFSLAIALQNLLWGVGQPFAGAVADRFGAVRVICAGAILYALGLAVMAYATTPGLMHLGAGVLIGFGLSGSSFNLILGAFGKLLPPRMAAARLRGRHRGGLARPVPLPADRATFSSTASAGTRRSSSLPSPCSLRCRSRSCSPAAATRRRPAVQPARAPVDPAGARRGVPAPQLRAAGARLLHLRLPARLHHRASAGLSSRTPGCPASVGGWTLAVIGLANAVGSLSAGLADDADVEALAPRLDLSRALGRDRGVHPDADLARELPSSSASPWACYGSRRCRRPRRS